MLSAQKIPEQTELPSALQNISKELLHAESIPSDHLLRGRRNIHQQQSQAREQRKLYTMFWKKIRLSSCKEFFFRFFFFNVNN